MTRMVIVAVVALCIGIAAGVFVPDEVAQLSGACSIDALWAYRSAVGSRSRELFGDIDMAELENERV